MATNYPYYDPYAAPEPPYGYLPPTPPTAPQRPRRRAMWAAGVAAVAAGALIGGLAVGFAGPATVSGSGSAAATVPVIPGDMNRNPGGTPASVSLATAAQQKGIVTVVSVLRYQNAESAGTGMVLTPGGEVLTNNHVIDGATSITVTVASSGRSYRADVVGTAPTEDVAVLQLRNASGLQTAAVGTSSGVSVGDAVVGVGNAGGTGTLRAASGTVTALNRSITATDETGLNSERLSGLIQTDAGVIAGDSGGPLYDASGKVIGMDTAASSNQAVTSAAYAIPIDHALKVADQIESGVGTSTIHIGLPAFLGVQVEASGGQGALVSGLLGGGPAADAGITPGSVITKVDGTTVTSPTSLKTAMHSYRPGQHATITWTTPGGASRSATVVLGTGPAD